MADPEQLAGHLRQTSAEREIIAAIGAIDDLRAIEAVRHHDRAHRVGMPLGLLGTELEAPGAHRGCHRRDGDAGRIHSRAPPPRAWRATRASHGAEEAPAYRENNR